MKLLVVPRVVVSQLTFPLTFYLIFFFGVFPWLCLQLCTLLFLHLPLSLFRFPCCDSLVHECAPLQRRGSNFKRADYLMWYWTRNDLTRAHTSDLWMLFRGVTSFADPPSSNALQNGKIRMEQQLLARNCATEEGSWKFSKFIEFQCSFKFSCYHFQFETFKTWAKRSF